MSEDKILQIISNETKDTINRINVVTPSMYASIFSKFSHEHQLEIDDEKKLSQNLLATECATLTEMQDKAASSANILTEHTDKAITAIKAKDEDTLGEVLQETQKLREELEQLKEAVYKDELTNVFNRKWMHDNYLQKDGVHFAKSGILAMIDLNYFKIINDTYGHIIGDKVLIFMANHLQTTNNHVVRYGGDEFIILFPHTVDAHSAKETLNKLREKVLSKKLKAHNNLFTTSFSIGIAEFLKDDNISTTVDYADKNMYKDKEEIKKRVTGI